MRLTVRVPEWELEESGRLLEVGEALTSWLTFRETDGSPVTAAAVQVVRGVASQVRDWPGGELGRHPVRLDVHGGSLYWDAPAPVEGQVEVTGTVETNNVAAPEDFPETTGVLRRIRMEWTDFVLEQDGAWRGTGQSPRYEEVSATYLPRVQESPHGPEVEAEMERRARRAYEREVSLGRLRPGDRFTVSMAVRGDRSAIAPGTLQTWWTGVLVDLETTGDGRG